MRGLTLFALAQDEFGYVLLLNKQPKELNGLSQSLETKLQEAFHYRHARALGQLKPASVAVVEDIEQLVSNSIMDQGKVLGNVKQNYLMFNDAGLERSISSTLD